MIINQDTKPIYLDYNASTPIDPEVKQAMMPYLEECHGNPSSSHWYGVTNKSAVEKARGQVASILNCDPEEIVFTSGGTESNNFAIRGIVEELKDKGNHIITSQIEHPAVTEVCKYLETEGFDITYLPVDEFGSVNPLNVEESITSKTILITIMHANNEVGTIQPIKEISGIARENGIIMHTDAAQAIAKVPTEVNELGVDLLTIAGHKIYAPLGVGALYIKNGTKLKKLMHGAGHERGWRPGTENVLEIVGLGQACEVGKRDLDKNMSHMSMMRDRLYGKLKNNIKEIRVNGHPKNRLPNTLSLSFRGVDSDSILLQISDKVAVSSGSACHTGEVEISQMLKAMNIPFEWARGTLRISVGRMTTPSEIDIAADAISQAVNRLEKVN